MKQPLILIAILVAAIPLTGISYAAKSEGSRTVIEGPPYSQPKTSPSTKVIYGIDDRRDVYQESDLTRLQQAASTCGLFVTSQLTNNGNGTFSIALSSYTKFGVSGCPDEPYRTQPTAAFCTGFLVGPDLIATAGHCYDASDLAASRFVFGFQMANSSTVISTVNANKVYTGTSIVGRALVGDLDYAVIRLDRAVTSPGAVVQQLRRKGVLATDTNVGAIGHPAGLPMKIAFGAETRALGVSSSLTFNTNLDVYGGNSGSPVFNAFTNRVEGILVRGATDYVNAGGCFRSNVLASTPGFEDVSRSNQIANLVPGLTTDREGYGPGTSINISVVEDNLVAPSFFVNVTATGGDVESVLVSDPNNDNIYTGSIVMAASGAGVVTGNNAVETTNAGVITVIYNDANAGAGVPVTFTDTAIADFAIANATVELIPGPTHITAVFRADEPVNGTIEIGSDCVTFAHTAASAQAGLETTVTVTGLESCTLYRVLATANDEANNEIVLNNGNCFSVLTREYINLSLENEFEPNAPGWTTAAATGTNSWAIRVSANAASPTRVYSYVPASAGVHDSSLRSPAITAPGNLEFFHTFQTEGNFDGGVLEYSVNGGSTWLDAGSRITEGGYTGVLDNSSGNPIGGRNTWTGGTLGTMRRVEANFTNLSGPISLRWRFGSDTSVTSAGWEIDDVRYYQGIEDCVTAAADWALYE